MGTIYSRIRAKLDNPDIHRQVERSKALDKGSIADGTIYKRLVKTFYPETNGSASITQPTMKSDTKSYKPPTGVTKLKAKLKAKTYRPSGLQPDQYDPVRVAKARQKHLLKQRDSSRVYVR
tara:strand:+ start:1894 stop:2256 length:363 start_codon:yes stop_codon:yes gene_type:complete